VELFVAVHALMIETLYCGHEAGDSESE
jgi:hypothetical protein